MKTRVPLVPVILLIAVILSACGPSKAQLEATATQVAANIFGTLTAQAPTATPTATPTNTPAPTPTPTPGLSSVELTLNDLPAAYEPLPADEIQTMLQSAPRGATAFGFVDNNTSGVVVGMLFPYSTRAEQAAFDASLQQLVETFAAAVGAGSNFKRLRTVGDVGEARAGITSVSKVASLSMRWDVVGFRRGKVGVLLVVGYPDGDKSAVVVSDLAGVLDERISKFLASHP